MKPVNKVILTLIIWISMGLIGSISGPFPPFIMVDFWVMARLYFINWSYVTLPMSYVILKICEQEGQ